MKALKTLIPFARASVLVVLIALVAFASASQAAAPAMACPSNIGVSFGTFTKENSAEIQKTDRAEMLKLAGTQLSDSTYFFSLVRKTAKTCWFKNKALALDAVVKARGQTVNVTFSRDFSTESPDEDTEIFVNQFVFNLKFKIKPEPKELALTTATKSNVVVGNRFKYSTCGLADCTEQGDDVDTLGTFSTVTILSK